VFFASYTQSRQVCCFIEPFNKIKMGGKMKKINLTSNLFIAEVGMKYDVIANIKLGKGGGGGQKRY
jgi:hypothetical protein